MKKLCLAILLIYFIPALCLAEFETDKITEGGIYNVKIYPFGKFLIVKNLQIIFNPDQSIEVLNCIGSGYWTYTLNSNRRFLAHYVGETEKEGHYVYINFEGVSNFLGRRIRGNGYYAIGNFSAPSPSPGPCTFKGILQ